MAPSTPAANAVAMCPHCHQSRPVTQQMGRNYLVLGLCHHTAQRVYTPPPLPQQQPPAGPPAPLGALHQRLMVLPSTPRT